MASPVVESLCCVPTVPGLELKLLSTVGSMSYNAISLAAAILGMGGAIHQLRVLNAWLQPSASYRRARSLQTSGPSISWWLAVADLFAAAGVFVRSFIWLAQDSSFKNVGTADYEGRIICVLLATWIHFFYTLTYLWTLMYCIDCVASVGGVRGSMPLYHHCTWPVSAILSTVGLLSLYAPDMACHNSDTNPYVRFLPNYLSTAVPLALVITVCPFLYCIAANKLHIVVAGMSGRYTLSERTLVSGIKRRFFFMCLAFNVCWLPNVINAIVLWLSWDNLPFNFLSCLWYLMAALNPLQGLFNSFLYPNQSARNSYFSGGCSLFGMFYALVSLVTCGCLRQENEERTKLLPPVDFTETDDVEREVYEDLSSSEYQSASSSPRTRGSLTPSEENSFWNSLATKV